MGKRSCYRAISIAEQSWKSHPPCLPNKRSISRKICSCKEESGERYKYIRHCTPAVFRFKTKTSYSDVIGWVSAYRIAKGHIELLHIVVSYVSLLSLLSTLSNTTCDAVVLNGLSNRPSIPPIYFLPTLVAPCSRDQLAGFVMAVGEKE